MRRPEDEKLKMKRGCRARRVSCFGSLKVCGAGDQYSEREWACARFAPLTIDGFFDQYKHFLIVAMGFGARGP